MNELFSLKGKGVSWGTLALAFALAVSLWVYVTVQDNPVIEQRFEVPVDYVNLSDNLALADKTENVKLRVAAPTNVMNTLSAADINAVVDLSGAVQGQYTAKLRFDLPPNVDLVSADANEIVLMVDALRQVQKNLQINYESDLPAEGFMQLDAVLSPQEIVLSGSEEKLRLIDDVYVSVDLAGLTGNYRASLPVQVVDANGNSLLNWVKVQPAMVDVLVPVISEQPSKVLPIDVTISGEPADGYVISRVVVDPAVTTAFGAYSKLDKLDYIYTSAVNVNNATNKVSQSVTLLTVDDVTFDQSVDYKVVVMIEKEATREIEDVAISLVNQQSDYNYQLEQSTCSVQVSGPVSVVSTLTNRDIEARIDVGSLLPGSYRPVVRALTAANVEAVTPDSMSVGLKVTRKQP